MNVSLEGLICIYVRYFYFMSSADVCDHSVQHPSPSLTVVFFLFERSHQERKEKLFILYMIPEKEQQVSVGN